LLDDGNTLWFGRTDAEDRAYVEHIRNHLWLAGLVSAVFMLLPLGGLPAMCCAPCRT
jgi:hypothetical protein